MRLVKPHTDDWFTGLEHFNPQQATQTRLLIELSHSSRVCSICGDKDSLDYYVTNSPLLCKEYATLRLCADCVVVRESRHGEKLARLV